MTCRRILVVLSFVTAAAGCSLSVAATEQDVCAEMARSMGTEFTVAAAYRTTVGDLRSFVSDASQPPLWNDLAGDDKAVLCYLDGPVAKAPPQSDHPYDRAAVAVYGDRNSLIRAGYQDSFALRAP